MQQCCIAAADDMCTLANGRRTSRSRGETVVPKELVVDEIHFFRTDFFKYLLGHYWPLVSFPSVLQPQISAGDEMCIIPACE